MTKFNFLALANLAVLVAASAAFAGDKDSNKDGQPSQPGAATPARVISLEEFKARCQDPSKTDVQKAPENIRIACTDAQTVWHAANPGEIALAATRVVSATVLADKFAVAAEVKELPTTQKNGVCQRFAEAVESYTIEKPMSCAEILNSKATVHEICLNVLDSQKGKHQGGKDKDGMVKTEYTGKVIDTCGDLAIKDH